MPNNSRRVQCIFPDCGHAQTIRVRAGRTWCCKKCKRWNPGPGMMAELLVGSARQPPAETPARQPTAGRDGRTGRFVVAPNGAAAVQSAGTPAPAPAARQARVGGTTSRATTSPVRRRSAPQGRNDETGGAGTPLPPKTPVKPGGEGNGATAERSLFHRVWGGA